MNWTALAESPVTSVVARPATEGAERLGSSNTVGANFVARGITVNGRDETVLKRNGAPIPCDGGRELGMLNGRPRQVPA